MQRIVDRESEQTQEFVILLKQLPSRVDVDKFESVIRIYPVQGTDQQLARIKGSLTSLSLSTDR